MTLKQARKILNIKATATDAEVQKVAQLHIDNSGCFPIRFKKAAQVIQANI